MNYQNEEGHLNDESIARYVEVLHSENWDSLPEEIHQHIESCTNCHQQALDLYAIVSHSATSVVKQEAPMRKGGRIVRMRIMRWAMVAVLAGLSFYFYRYLDRQKPIDNIEVDGPIANDPDQVEDTKNLVEEDPGNSTPKKEDTANPPKSTIPEPEKDVRELYAANFVPSESMESLLADQLRSGNIDLIAPSTEEIQDWRDGISFEWSGVNAEGLRLRLENNRAEVLYEKAVEDLRHTIHLELEPGIYYWRLESEEDLLMLGRLILE